MGHYTVFTIREVIPHMSVPAQLYRLEELDSEIGRIEAELAEGRRRAARNREVEAAEARLEALRAQAATAAAQQRGLEAELASIETRIDRDQKRMYGGTIVDARELASLERELGHYREQRDDLEERVLALMERTEALQTEIETAAHGANTLRERWDEDRALITSRAENLRDTLAAMRSERDDVAAEIPAATLGQYSRVRKATGHAVTTIGGGVCGGCRVGLPPKDVQHAYAGQLVACSNCGRILYAGS